METVDKQPRLIEVEPLEGESLSHFLGRFRRANYLTTTGLGKLTGLGAVISRWEKLLLNPFPTRQELEALANVVGIDVERLGEMLPPKGVGGLNTNRFYCVLPVTASFLGIGLSGSLRIDWDAIATCCVCYRNAPIARLLSLFQQIGCKGNVNIVFYRLQQWRNIRSSFDRTEGLHRASLLDYGFKGAR